MLRRSWNIEFLHDLGTYSHDVFWSGAITCVPRVSQKAVKTFANTKDIWLSTARVLSLSQGITDDPPSPPSTPPTSPANELENSFEGEDSDWGFVEYGKDDSNAVSNKKKEKKDENSSFVEATKSFWYTGKLSLMSSFYNLYQRCMCS